MKTYTDFGHCLQDDATKASFPKDPANREYRRFLSERAAGVASTQVVTRPADNTPSLADRIAALEAKVG